MSEAAPIDVAALAAEHYAAVYRYAYRLAGNAADAEDLTQQAFLAAQAKLEQLRATESGRAWLFSILRNCFLAGRRRERNATFTAPVLRIDEIPDEPPPRKLDGELLQKALDSLPDEYRLVLLMYYFEEYSYRQIAESLELPIGTVMSRLSRAKGTLRSGLWGARLKEMLNTAGTRGT